MLSLVLFAYDPIAVWGLVVAIIGVLVGIVAAIAAILAAYYAKKAPTSDDLARVEQNTVHLQEVRSGVLSLDARMKRQDEDKDLAARAQSVSIIVSGQADNAAAFLPLNIRWREANVQFTRVELCNPRGNVAGEVQCRQSHDPTWAVADVPSQLVSKWRNEGKVDRGFITEHVLRVWMLFDGHRREAYRNVPVTLTQARRVSDSSGGDLIPVNRVEGAV